VNLDVDEQRIRPGEYAWYVPVRPDREPRKLFPYYEALADVEEELDEKEQLRVVLTPVDAVEV
jgi:hypothetical protein